jgi:hypothetical protein
MVANIKKSLRGFHQAGIYSVGFIVLRYLFVTVEAVLLNLLKRVICASKECTATWIGIAWIVTG